MYSIKIVYIHVHSVCFNGYSMYMYIVYVLMGIVCTCT